MRRSIVLAWICLSLGCDSGQPDPGAPAQDPTREAPVTAPAPIAAAPVGLANPPVGAWVVIDERLGIYDGPGSEAQPIRLPPGDAPRRRVAEVVSIAQDFIELRTIAADSESVCVNTLGVSPLFELRMFVKPDALLPVLARPKTVELEDGTKLELAAGVPVIQSGEEGLVLIDDVLLDVQLTDADVGRWSAAALYEPAPDLPEADLATAGVVLHYGNRSITSDSARFAAANDVDDANLLTFVNACGRFVLRPGVHRTPKQGLYRLKGPGSAIPASDRELDPDSILGSASKPAPCPLQPLQAVADAPLRWPSGAVAGKVLTSHPLPDAATQSGDQVCVELSGLEVCLDAELDPHVLDCTPRRQREFPEFDVPKGRRVTRGKPTVSAGLESDIVERIVRAHATETLACYDAALTRDPTLAGRIEIAFVIGRTGRVSTSKVHSSTLEPELDHTNVATCVSRAIKRWSFPKARDGVTVSVVYPFDLSPS